MAKKKVADATIVDDLDLTERLLKSVEKDFGKEVIVDGDTLVSRPPQTIPISPAMDIITGGIDEGSWVGITGQPKHGKTNLVLSFAANAQKPEYGSRPIFYDKIEGRLSTTHLRGVKGLDTSRGKFNVIQSVEGRILTAQDHLNIVERIIRTVPGAVVIMDSISALMDEAETTGGLGTQTRGGMAKVLTQFVGFLAEVVPVNRTIVLGITHLIANTGGGMGAKYVEKVARRFTYQCNYLLKAKFKKPWMVGTKQIGLQVNWSCLNSPRHPPSSIDSYIRYGVGIDEVFELINLGLACQLIRQNKAWFYVDFLMKEAHNDIFNENEPPVFQGSERLYAAFIANESWRIALAREVNEMAGGISTGESGEE